MKFENLIHWWELPSECPIKIKQNYINKIIKSTNIHMMKKRTLQNIKLEVNQPKVKTIKRLLNSLNINFNNIDNKITHIKTHNKLIKIKFPIKESPLHLQILAHTIFDGSKEKNACLRYKVRFDIITKDLFKMLLIKSFGNNCYGHTDNCYFLYKSLSELLANHYKIKEYHSKRAYFPKNILKLAENLKFRRAILRAAFVDEGHSKHNIASKNHEKFRLTLVSSIKNRRLAKQLLYLVNMEGYKASLYSARNNTEFTISILKESKRDFYKGIISPLPKYHRKRVEAESALAALPINT